MMNYTIKQNVAVVRPDYPLSDGQDAAKLINAVRFQTGCTSMLMDRSAFVPELFTLSSGVAERVLKPFTQNKMRLAIVGDFMTATRPPCGTLSSAATGATRWVFGRMSRRVWPG